MTGILMEDHFKLQSPIKQNRKFLFEKKKASSLSFSSLQRYFLSHVIYVCSLFIEGAGY